MSLDEKDNELIKSMRGIFILIWIIAAGCVAKQSGLSASMVDTAPPVSYRYTEMTQEDRPYNMLPSFCLKTTTPLIEWKIQIPDFIELKLYNRWGSEVLLVNDPRMIPAAFFTSTPAGIAAGSVLLYTLTYKFLNGEKITISGSINYMGEMCSN